MEGNCPMCAPNLGPVIADGPHWRLVLNRNQNLLGKCFLAARRHLEAVPELSSEEWLDLRRQLGLATRMLDLAFRPDHFNYAFLQNQDRHVHLHVVPRYADRRTFAGAVFADPNYPEHYAVPAPARLLTDEQMAALARLLHGAAREAMPDPAGMAEATGPRG